MEGKGRGRGNMCVFICKMISNINDQGYYCNFQKQIILFYSFLVIKYVVDASTSFKKNEHFLMKNCMEIYSF